MNVFDLYDNMKRNIGKGMDMFNKGMDALPNDVRKNVYKAGFDALLSKKHGGEVELDKRGGKRKAKRKPKVSQKASQNQEVNVNVKNIIRPDMASILPDMYKKQMIQTQNVGRQSLMSGPPIQWAQHPAVIHIQHPNIFREPVSDLIGQGTNPVSYRHRVAVEDDNINQPIIVPVNPNDITQRTPDRRLVPSTQMLPSFNIAGNMGVIPQLPVNPIQEGSIPHMHSSSLDMTPQLISMRAEPSQPSVAGMSSQLIGLVERRSPITWELQNTPQVEEESSSPIRAFTKEINKSMLEPSNIKYKLPEHIQYAENPVFEPYVRETPKKGRPSKEEGLNRMRYEEQQYYKNIF